MLHLVSGSLDLISALLLIGQQSGIHADGVILVGMHGIVDQRHHEQDDQNHDQVDGVEQRFSDRSLIGHITKGFAFHQAQGDGAGEAGVPDDEAGISGGDQQGIVNITDALGDLLGQQSAGNQTEAPVQPAADDRNKGGDDDGLLLVVGQVGDGAQTLFAGAGRSHGVTEDQHQSHLHGKGQQTPEAGVVTPLFQHGDGTHTGCGHRAQEDDDGQDHGEQKGVGQPAVDDTNAAVCELFEHKYTLLFKILIN